MIYVELYLGEQPNRECINKIPTQAIIFMDDKISIDIKIQNTPSSQTQVAEMFVILITHYWCTNNEWYFPIFCCNISMYHRNF